MGGDIKGRIHMKTIAKILFVTVAFGAMASFSGCTKKEKTERFYVYKNDIIQL